MHPVQEKLLEIIGLRNLNDLTLRQIGDLVGETLPQKIKHHLSQLEKKGFISIDKNAKKIQRINKNSTRNNPLISIPIVGSANCGPATLYATQNIEGHLRISKRLIPNKKNLFAIRASGTSLNKASIKGKNIEDGDFVIVDNENVSPHDGDYIVSIIDGMANIKKYRLDKNQSRIALLSESTREYSPIFIHKDDDFRVNGTVVDVIKNIK